MTVHKQSKNISRWALVLAITCLLFFVALFAFRLSWLIAPEESVINLSTKYKKYLNENVFKNKFYDGAFIEKNFVLVNTVYDEALSKTIAPGGKDSLVSSITDRAKLAGLFKWLAENDTAFTIAVCDIYFSGPSMNTADDDSLNKYINQLVQKKKVIFAGHYDRYHNQFDKPYFTSISAAPLPSMPHHLGNTDYEAWDKEQFLEYDLTINNGQAKSLPLLLYERVYHTEATDGRILHLGSRDGQMGLLKLEDTKGNTIRTWNKFVPEILFNNADIEKIPAFESSGGTDTTAVMIRLASTVSRGGIAMETLLGGNNRNKIVFIGAFGRDHYDKHQTMYGQTDGAIVLLNIYHNLVTRENRVNALFLFFLFAVLFLIAMDIVFHGCMSRYFFIVSNICFLYFIPRLLLDGLGTIAPGFKLASKDLTHWIEMKSHYFILLLTALLSNFFFNKIINVIVLSLFVFVLYNLFKYLYNKKTHSH